MEEEFEIIVCMYIENQYETKSFTWTLSKN